MPHWDIPLRSGFAGVPLAAFGTIVAHSGADGSAARIVLRSSLLILRASLFDLAVRKGDMQTNSWSIIRNSPPVLNRRTGTAGK